RPSRLTCGKPAGLWTSMMSAESTRKCEKWPSARDDHFPGACQEELLAAGALLADEPADEPDDAADEPLLEPVEEPPDELVVDDSDFAGLLVVLVVLSEPDERESVR
ncbi:hypothetical protein, partial [Micromonospora sp. I033]